MIDENTTPDVETEQEQNNKTEKEIFSGSQ